MGITPSITGKVELVYEGEQEGAAYVAQMLIASHDTYLPGYFPKIEKLEKPGMQKQPIYGFIEWFFESGFELLDDATVKNMKEH
jgi:magnesium chelatase subunit I